MSDPLLLSAVCAFITAAVLIYAGRTARKHGRQPLSVFRGICALWFARYALSLASNAIGSGALALAADHRVILASNISMAVAALATLSEWRMDP